MKKAHRTSWDIINVNLRSSVIQILQKLINKLKYSLDKTQMLNPTMKHNIKKITSNNFPL